MDKTTKQIVKDIRKNQLIQILHDCRTAEQRHLFIYGPSSVRIAIQHMKALDGLKEFYSGKSDSEILDIIEKDEQR